MENNHFTNLPKFDSLEQKLKYMERVLSSLILHSSFYNERHDQLIKKIRNDSRWTHVGNTTYGQMVEAYPPSKWFFVKGTSFNEYFVTERTPENQSSLDKIEFFMNKNAESGTLFLKAQTMINNIKKQIERSSITGSPNEVTNHTGGQVPAELKHKKSTIDNPYFKGSMTRYAGPINKMSWGSSRMKEMCDNLDKILKRNGTTFKHIYYGKWKETATSTRSSFAAESTDGRFRWYKYDGSTTATGQNIVYVGSYKMKTSDFLSYPSTQQDELLNS